MVATCIGFGAAFFVGAILVTIGAAGAEWVDCPAVLDQFPATEMRCNLFSGFVGGGGLMTIAGGAVATWILAFCKWPE